MMPQLGVEVDQCYLRMFSSFYDARNSSPSGVGRRSERVGSLAWRVNSRGSLDSRSNRNEDRGGRRRTRIR